MASFTKLPNNAIGANIEQMSQLAQTLTQSVEELEAVFKKVDSKIEQTTWSGNDATRTEGEWTNTRNQMMNNLRTTLSQVSQVIKTNAADQTSTSSN
jgi:uncharacterized protein YukE